MVSDRPKINSKSLGFGSRRGFFVCGESILTARAKEKPSSLRLSSLQLRPACRLSEEQPKKRDVGVLWPNRCEIKESQAVGGNGVFGVLDSLSMAKRQSDCSVTPFFYTLNT